MLDVLYAESSVTLNISSMFFCSLHIFSLDTRKNFPARLSIQRRTTTINHPIIGQCMAQAEDGMQKPYMY
jgi:hypothetical protein